MAVSTLFGCIYLIGSLLSVAGRFGTFWRVLGRFRTFLVRLGDVWGRFRDESGRVSEQASTFAWVCVRVTACHFYHPLPPEPSLKRWGYLIKRLAQGLDKNRLLAIF